MENKPFEFSGSAPFGRVTIDACFSAINWPTALPSNVVVIPSGCLGEEPFSACKTAPCTNGATCTPSEISYDCTCAAGYRGSVCEINIDECASSPCVNGTCTDGVNGFNCSCMTGFVGPLCDVNVNDCASNPCLNGGSCIDGLANYTCECLSSYVYDGLETNTTLLNVSPQCEVLGLKLVTPPGQQPPSTSTSWLTLPAIIGIAVGGTVLLIILIAIAVSVARNSNKAAAPAPVVGVVPAAAPSGRPAPVPANLPVAAVAPAPAPSGSVAVPIRS